MKHYIKSPCVVDLHKLEQMTQEALRFIERNPHLFACKWDDVFAAAPKTGAFRWDEEEAGEWIPFPEDEGTWTKVAYATNIWRDKKGKESCEIVSVDPDGNWDTVALFEGKPKSKMDKQEWDYQMATNHCYYTLLRLSLYAIDVCLTGKDPLGNCIDHTADPREVHARDLAYEVPELCARVWQTATEAVMTKGKR